MIYLADATTGTVTGFPEDALGLKEAKRLVGAGLYVESTESEFRKQREVYLESLEAQRTILSNMKLKTAAEVLGSASTSAPLAPRQDGSSWRAGAELVNGNKVRSQSV